MGRKPCANCKVPGRPVNVKVSWSRTMGWAAWSSWEQLEEAMEMDQEQGFLSLVYRRREQGSRGK